MLMVAAAAVLHPHSTLEFSQLVLQHKERWQARAAAVSAKISWSSTPALVVLV